MEFQPQIILPTPTRRASSKKCPDCDCKFSRAKWIWSRRFERKTRVCPRCEVALFYRKINGKTLAIPYEDKHLVDKIIGKINTNMMKLSGFPLNESTIRERKFAYEMIDWAIEFLDGCEADVGMTTHEFVDGLISFVLNDDWWSMHLTSLLMIRNTRARLAWDYWEAEARKKGVDTPRSTRIKAKLKKLMEEMPV